MSAYDWIVVGGGIAGAALGYELARAGCSVLILDQGAGVASGTRYSYGGIAYWSGTGELMQTFCQEGIAIHRSLSEELGSDTQFREIDLLLTINPDRDPEAIAQIYSDCLIPPQLITAQEAQAIEPLLNRQAIAAALHGTHGHVEPELTTRAYLQAFQRHGGQMILEAVTGFRRQGDRIVGVVTPAAEYSAENVVVCAGGWSRALLQQTGLPTRVYFTLAEIVETPPLPEVKLQALVMAAELQRFNLEAQVGSAEVDPLWDATEQELAPPILDEGVIQFLDGRLRIGQITRVITSLQPLMDECASEAALRSQTSRLLPKLSHVPGRWCQCPVAFSGDRLPLVGPVPGAEGIHLFSGFSNPFALLPAIARRYAKHVTGTPDPLMEALSPQRFEAAA